MLKRPGSSISQLRLVVCLATSMGLKPIDAAMLPRTAVASQGNRTEEIFLGVFELLESNYISNWSLIS
jgi:hypothetical protein